AVASGSSPGSAVPAGSSRRYFLVASRSCRTSATQPSSSTATIATAPGCSTISRSVSPQRSTVMPRRRPRQGESETSGSTRAPDQCDGDVDHRLQVRDRDPLVRAVEVVDAVREIEAAETAVVEHVRVCRAAREVVAHLVTATPEGLGGEQD